MIKATKRIILAGDQNQLPQLVDDKIADETVDSTFSENEKVNRKEELNKSLFGTIFNNLKGVDPRREIMLNEQFRMHPFIGDFISKIYYDKKLKSGLENQESLKQHGLTLDWAKNKVAGFL
jgi:superfamily I DNA and/or RNA helicase